MHFRPPYRPAGDRVYHAIKARLIAYEFPPGRRIYLEPIAESLGVSTTPVREAMNRLAERDLVIKAENKGFYAMTLSEARVKGNYELACLLLTLGLESLQPAAEKAMQTHAPIAELLNRLNRRVVTDGHTLARYTGELFNAIAAFLDNSAARQAIDMANDHLYFMRTLECRHGLDVQSELKRLCELFLSGKRSELIGELKAYQDKRLELLQLMLGNQAS